MDWIQNQPALVLVTIIACAYLAAFVFGPRNGWSVGGSFLTGLLLGPIGLVIVALVRRGPPQKLEL